MVVMVVVAAALGSWLRIGSMSTPQGGHALVQVLVQMLVQVLVQVIAAAVEEEEESGRG